MKKLTALVTPVEVNKVRSCPCHGQLSIPTYGNWSLLLRKGKCDRIPRAVTLSSNDAATLLSFLVLGGLVTAAASGVSMVALRAKRGDNKLDG